jgi:adenine-specific DNA-methyltransferase
MTDANKDKPETFDLNSDDVAARKRADLKRLFPEVFNEDKIDFEQLRRAMGDWIDEGSERFGLTWSGKADCMKVIQAPATGSLRPDIDGSVNFEHSDHIFIEGDNLEVLKLLQKAYFGKIKVIYIDPPYNTGKEFVYPDRYAENFETYLQYTGQKDGDGKKFSTNTESAGRFHSKWLNMMYPRLHLARNLLSEDGIILLSIDENEVHNLKSLADQIFGQTNYAGEIIWKNSSKNDQAYISMQHEYILCYVKNKERNSGKWEERKEGLEEIYRAFAQFKKERGEDWEAIHQDALDWYNQFPESNPINGNKHYNWMDSKGVYFASDISGPNYGQYRYDLIHPRTKKVCKEPASGWRYPEETMRQRVKDDLVHFGTDHSTVPCNKTYLKDAEMQSITSVKFRDGRGASNRLKTLFGEKVFTNPKDEILLKDIFKALNVGGQDLVLDFFAGSGSTAHAIFELNRETGSDARAILVQLPEKLDAMLESATGGARKVVTNEIQYLSNRGLPLTISEIAKERLRLSAEQYDGDGATSIGFRSFKLSPSSFSKWDAESDTAPPDLISKIDAHAGHLGNENDQDILFELLLKDGFPLATEIESLSIGSRTVFSIEDGALLICLERNLTKDLIDALADIAEEKDAARVVCLDAGFQGNDQLKTNAVQTFKSRLGHGEDGSMFRTV